MKRLIINQESVIYNILTIKMLSIPVVQISFSISTIQKLHSAETIRHKKKS